MLFHELNEIILFHIFLCIVCFEFLEVFESHVLEKDLLHRLNELKYFRKLGCKTYEDIQNYIDEEDKKTNIGRNNRKRNLSSQNIILDKRHCK